jgi:hypothetical protein
MRVNAEQASKQVMQEPTRLRFGEGRRQRMVRANRSVEPAGVVATACMQTGIRRNTGDPSGDSQPESTGNS